MVVAAPRDPSMLRFVMDEFQPSSRGGPELSPNFGDGLKDQAAA
jgi:hypothetical protein